MQSNRTPKRETTREYILRILEQKIVMLELEPGCQLSENELAAEIGVSRTPVREALLELSKSKIIEIYPQKGSYVSLIDWNLIEEAQFMRLTLEKAVVRQACMLATNKDCEELEKNVKLQKFYIENNEPSKLIGLDNAFHKALFRITNKLNIYKLMGSIMLHFDRLRALRVKVVPQEYVIEDHLSLIEAIRRKDPDMGESIMEKHLTRHEVDETIVRQMYPQYFH